MRIGPQNRYLNSLRKNYAQALAREASHLDFIASIAELVGCIGDVERAEIVEEIKKLKRDAANYEWRVEMDMRSGE